jgi:hypothetical protein
VTVANCSWRCDSARVVEWLRCPRLRGIPKRNNGDSGMKEVGWRCVTVMMMGVGGSFTTSCEKYPRPFSLFF